MIIIFFSYGLTAVVGLGFLIFAQLETRTTDQLVAETATLQHTTITNDRHPCPVGIRTRNTNKRAAADPRLRPRGQWDRG